MIARFVKDLKKYHGYLRFASQAELKSEVAGSRLNWLWWVLDPLFMMLIYMFLMLVLFRKNIPYAAIFVFLGLTMWDFFNKTLMRCSRIIKDKASLLKKVRCPKFLLVLQTMWVYATKMLISLALVAAMMVVWAIFPIDPAGPLVISPAIVWVIPVMLTFLLFTFGAAMFVTHVGVYLEDLRNVLQVVLKLLFYMCGVFYDVTSFDLYRLLPWLEPILTKINPVSFLMISLRQAALYQSVYEPWWLLGWAVVSVLLCWLGIVVVYKNENTYIKVI